MASRLSSSNTPAKRWSESGTKNLSMVAIQTGAHREPEASFLGNFAAGNGHLKMQF
jgi:hypothetical protein